MTLSLISGPVYNDLPADIQAKDCIKCHWEQLLDAFPPAQTRDGHGSTCRICLRDAYLQKKHGITIEDYNEQLDAQRGKCARCGLKALGGKALSVYKHNATACLQLVHDICPLST